MNNNNAGEQITQETGNAPEVMQYLKVTIKNRTKKQ